jgi:hypothetical protein
MTSSADSAPQLPPALLARSQLAQVATDEANARKAAADAESSALALSQAKYKLLVPDLTGVATDIVDDKSTDVAFSGLVTYSALNKAADDIADRIAVKLGVPDKDDTPSILVTSQSDLLTNDLLWGAVSTGLDQLIEFADQVLAQVSESTVNLFGPVVAPPTEPGVTSAEVTSPAAVSAGFTGAALAGVGAAAFGPFGIAAAAATAIPSVASLLSSTTSIKSQSETITDLTTTTSVVSKVSDRLGRYTVLHEDFRLAPIRSNVGDRYQVLAGKRSALLFEQEKIQIAKNDQDLELSRAQQQQDAATKAKPAKAADSDLASKISAATESSASFGAALSLISGAISSIDAFSTTINTGAVGTRPPIAIASLYELLHLEGDEGIRYILSVKGLGGQSEEYTKDRRVGHDTYTTLADASISFMLFDAKTRKIISSGVANGVSSVQGRPGQAPT